MGWVLTQLAALRDFAGPMGNQRSADAALVNPRFVEAMGGVARRRESGSEAEVGCGAAHRSGGVVSVSANHDFGTGAIVGGEKDERIVPAIHGTDLIEDASDLAVHAIDHGRVDGHFGGLKALLFRG